MDKVREEFVRRSCCATKPVADAYLRVCLVGIPIGKLMLYTALAGVDPRFCLPVMLDVGTENQAYLDDKFYTGLRQRCERGPAYDALITEFFAAAQARWGRTVLLQFEDFANANAARLLNKFRDAGTVFNDDIPGTASVIVAGVLAALRLTPQKRISEHKFLFYGTHGGRREEALT
jgi:malate dehydrogenase (oxaloacetate-decarboxylating)(NADP+)